MIFWNNHALLTKAYGTAGFIAFIFDKD